jgi:hypothetical protein
VEQGRREAVVGNVEQVQVAYREQASTRTPGGLAGTPGRVSGKAGGGEGGAVQSSFRLNLAQAVSASG